MKVITLPQTVFYHKQPRRARMNVYVAYQQGKATTTQGLADFIPYGLDKRAKAR